MTMIHRFDRRCRNIFLALAPAVVLAACAAPGYGPTAGAAVETGRWMPVDATGARIAAPGSPEVLAAREMRTSQGELIQEVTLANRTALPGQNRLSLSVDYGPPSLLAADPYAVRVGRYTMTPQSLALETRESLSAGNIPDQPGARANRYGIYNYVDVEHPGGVRCILVWQSLPTDTVFARIRRAAAEYRMCDVGRSVEELLKPFDDLQLTL
jgi:hypothetical protein